MGRTTDQVDNTGLDESVREHSGDRLGKAFEAIDHGDQVSPMPRALSSFMTRSQNLAPSVCSIHSPRTSL